MKKTGKSFQWMILLSVISSCYGTASTGKKEQEPVIPNNISVVELFTSEGCSSCPPADNLLSVIGSENKEVYVLSYHVDYWDRLGWKDPFSQAAFTNRQRNYATKFGLESIYTPQAVVNGAEEFVGSDEQRLRSSISRKSAIKPFGVQVQRKNAGAFTIAYDLKITTPASLCIAIVQPNAVSVVKRGENTGKRLHHVNVVHQLTIVDAETAGTSVEIKIPPALRSTGFRAIIFLQQVNDDRITAAANILVPEFADKKTGD